MKKEDFISSMAEIDDDLLGPVAAEEANREKRRIKVLFPIVAACVVAVAVALFAVSLGMRKPQTVPGISATDDRSVFTSDEKAPDSSDSLIETDRLGDLTTETETDTETETGIESDPVPVDSDEGYNNVSGEPGPGPDVTAPDTEKPEQTVREPEKTPVTPPVTDKQSESGDTEGSNPVPPDSGSDVESATSEPPIDPDREMTVEDLCLAIYRRLEGSPRLDLPGAAGGGFVPVGAPGDDPGSGYPEGYSEHSSAYKGNEFGSVWYYYYVVCRGYGATVDTLKSMAAGYANTPLLKGRTAKMLVDYLRYHLDDETFDFMKSYLTKREYPGFSDVEEGSEYRDDIILAYELGLIEPESDGMFGVNEPVTEEELNAYLDFINDSISFMFTYR
ncbi:MAG: S-layer homology domain-containing protein [Clostridia bacterium]|nr:S-layer homology domain-containing protein [Clostridia bacterium]